MTIEKMKQELEALAEKFSEGWHEGIKIDASDIMLLNDVAQALSESKKQEPVASGFIRTLVHIDKDGIETWEEEPFYTSPPQRQWVGLTDEEIGDEYVRFEVAKGGFTNFEYATRAIEAKLKEKNT